MIFKIAKKDFAGLTSSPLDWFELLGSCHACTVNLEVERKRGAVRNRVRVKGQGGREGDGREGDGRNVSKLLGASRMGGTDAL